MRITICTNVFSPRIGGIEVISALLAREFTALGHEVTLLTSEPAANDRTQWTFQVVRSPKASDTRGILTQSDTCLMMGASLRWVAGGISPLRLPMTISHQIPFEPWSGLLGSRQIVTSLKHLGKRALCQVAHNVYPSEFMRRQGTHDGIVIPNLFDSTAFQVSPNASRERDVAFLGRMVPEKGPSLLLEALLRLKSRGRAVKATFMGEGAERAKLEHVTHNSALRRFVHFTGPVTQGVAARQLAMHKILVVPSVWAEPFGVVALEGMAAGCLVLGTSVGGLGEAIGNAGLIVKASCADALADGLERLLTDTQLAAALGVKAQIHLAQHHPRHIAQLYLNVLEKGRMSANAGSRASVGARSN